MSILDKNKNLMLTVLLLIGVFFRFYSLNWGAPFYFHPDERNVVDLVLKSSLLHPETLTKGTFAYGNFPVILALLLKPVLVLLLKPLNILDPFGQTVVTLRVISAVFSALTLYIVYLCGKFWSEKVAFIALFISVFSTGLIQQAHFGTFDGFVAFCAVTVFLNLLNFMKTKKIFFFYTSLIFIALGSAAKINLLILTLFPIALLVLSNYKKRHKYLHVIKHSLIGVISMILSTIILSPNYITSGFFNSLFYERGLVTGAIPVFYTQSFFGTVPVFFQFIHILPFLINPLLTVIFIPAFFYILLTGIKSKNISYLLLVISFLLLFLPQAFLFAKWTRYMVPILPFAYLIIAVALGNFYSSSEARAKSRSSNLHTGDVGSAIQQFSNFLSSQQARTIILAAILITTAFFSLSYFITAFVSPDTRISASNFARKNIPKTASILSEPYDLGLMPFNSVSPNINIFNFYEEDNNSPEHTMGYLKQALITSDYIVLPSQRLLRSRVMNAKKFPSGHVFYTDLVGGRLGYKKIYETPCDIFCKITYLNNPVFGFEETATVFDRPIVFIFKKSL